MSGPEVTQADALAASRLWTPIKRPSLEAHLEAFARHRTAATEPLEAQIAMLVDALGVAEEHLAELTATPLGGEVWDRSDLLNGFAAGARAALAKIQAMKGEQ